MFPERSSAQYAALGAESHTTVSDVWNLALPAGTSLLGGVSGLECFVTWAVTLRAAFPLFGVLEKGYLALARPALAQQLDSSLTLTYLISELSRAGASALVVDGDVSSEDVALADRLSLPLFLLPKGVDLHRVEREILRTLVDREGQIARHELEARQSFQRALRCGGIQAVLDELSRLTSSRVLVRDHSGIEVGSSDVGGIAEGTAERVFPIQVGGRSLGHLFLLRDSTRDNILDMLRARQAAEVCGIELLERLTRWETEERIGAELVQRLLDETEDEEGLATRFLRLGYDLTRERRHVVIALGVAGNSSSVDHVPYVARSLQRAAQRDGAVVIVLNYHTYWLAFCALKPLGGDQGAGAQTMRHLTRKWLQAAVCDVAVPPDCCAGVSRLLEGVAMRGGGVVAQLRTAVRQALDALELGRRINGFESPYYYEELGLYRLLAGLRAQDELKRFYEETLGVLVRYDREHNTELVRTLEVFFEQNANASQTARALFVHRNTLNYRLQRVADLTGLDLNDAEARLAFQLALKIHRLVM